MANIRAIIASFLLIMETNNGILARIEFMVVLNSILLLILFIFDTYRRRSRSQLIKYILLAIDAVSHSMVLHTLGLMQGAPITNNLFEVWAILLTALRFSINYITVYGLQEQGRVQWNVEFGAAIASFTWAGKLNGTRGSHFKAPLWFLWALQPLRVGYMLLAYSWARNSYRQGRSSVLIADYMKVENGLNDPEPEASSSNKNESWNNSEIKSKGTNPIDYCGVGNLRTNSGSEIEIEGDSQKTDYHEPSSCNPNADVGTNMEVPSSSGAYDPSSMRGYRYLIQGETCQEIEAKRLEDKLQLRITHKEKLITLDKIWQCKGKLLGEWGDKDGQLKDLSLSFALYRLLRCRFDDYPLPEASILKTRKLLVDGILCRTNNHENTKRGNRGAEELQEGIREENKGTKEGNKSAEGEGKGSSNNQHGFVWYLLKLCIIISIMKWALALFFTKKKKDGSKGEEDEDEVKEEVAHRVFEITGTELSFLNDFMYSRFPVIFWRARGLFVSIFLYITVVACTCWVGISIVHVYTPPEGDFTHVVHGYNVDVFITWGMLLFILVKETWEILIYLFSDWTKVMLISMYVERTCTWCWLMENLIWLLCNFSMVGRWHGKIDQYNFLEAYDYKPLVCNLAYNLSLGSLPEATDGVKSKSQIVLPMEVKKAIVKSISSLLNEEPVKGRLPGGMHSILSRNNVSKATSQICELQNLPSCSHIILVWHIATSLCEIELCRHYNIYLADSELPSLWSSLNCCSSEPFLVKLERLGKDLSKNFIVANSLSRYCAHLLIKQSDLLPDHIFIAEEIFQHAVHEARNILEGCDTLQTIYKRLMREGEKGTKTENEKTIMRLSARLGKILIKKLDEAARWKALAGIWADLLVYTAPNLNVEAHKECLATGGELITHVWILLYHAGILENSLVKQGVYNDIENPDDGTIEDIVIVYAHPGEDNDTEIPNGIVEDSLADQEVENDDEGTSFVPVKYQVENDDNPHQSSLHHTEVNYLHDGSSPKDRRWSEGIDFNKMGPHFKYLHDQTIQRVPKFQFFTVPIQPQLFHHNERNIMIHIQDIDDLLTNKWLNVPIIQIYLLNMYKYCIKYGITSVGFMDPNQVNESFLETRKTESIEYMCHAMQAQEEKKLILAPYFQREHWILLVIMPGADTVYVLDSNPPPKPKYMIEEPFNVAYLKNRGPARGSNVSFKQFKCPRQPESWECGYYVMNFMQDIIVSHLDRFPDVEDVFADKYVRRDIENIRHQWGKFLRDELAQLSPVRRNLYLAN